MENQNTQWENWSKYPPQNPTEPEQPKTYLTETGKFSLLPFNSLLQFHHPLFTQEIIDLSEEGKRLPKDIFNSNPNLLSQCRNFVKVYLEEKNYIPKQKIDLSFIPSTLFNSFSSLKTNNTPLIGVIILNIKDMGDTNITFTSPPTENNLFKIGPIEKEYKLHSGDIFLFESYLDFKLPPDTLAIVFEVIPKDIIK